MPYVEREYQTGTSIPRTSGTRHVSDTKDADPEAVRRAIEQQTLAPNDPNTRSEFKLPPR